ncbi:MAG: CusA/CzcA family heavy metal efflux RND transporter, partial [Flavitalea sp.]
MLQHIIRFSVRNKLIIGLFTIALILCGGYSATRLPIDAVPDITNNQVQIITVSPSLAAPEIERLITFPIEQINANIPGILEIRSFSRFGLSLVTIVFSDATDVYWARQQVNERLQQVRSQISPETGNPLLAPVTTGLGEIFQYAIRAKKGYEQKYTPLELRTIQDWIVRRQLLGAPGVADVSSFGGYLKQYEVAVNPSRLQSLNVNINEVFNALQQNNQNTGGSYIQKGPNLLFIRTEGLAESIEDISRIMVKNTSDGIPVFIKDIADVRIGHANRYGAMCFNDEGEVAGAVVMMLKGENSSKVIKAVKERIVLIEKTLPEGVIIEPFLDRTKMVNHAIGTVEKNLLEGALIVIFILVLFLGNWRAGLIVASVIPLAMLFAIIMMNIFGVSGNLMSLGALDFGLIVDGAVIIVEAVMHLLYHRTANARSKLVSQEYMNNTVENAAGKMMGAAVFGQIIILIVYLPILSLVGIEGKMFKPMAQTVSFALIGAFILSLTYVPMIASLCLNKKINYTPNWADKMMGWLQSKYQPVLIKALQFPKTIIAVASGLLLLALSVLNSLGGEFIPKLEEGDFAVDTRVLTGSSLNATIEATQKTAAILLKKFPEVEKVVSKIGSGEIPTDPMPIEAADMMVILKDKKEWTSAKSFDELADKMSIAVQEVPGITTGFQYPVQMRFNELMTGARQDVVCKIFGEDLDTLAAYSKKLADIIYTVKGAKDVYLETVTGL